MNLATPSSSIPLVDWKLIEKDLDTLEKETFEAFPYNVVGFGRDSYTFNRIYPHLIRWKVSQYRLFQKLSHFSQKMLVHHTIKVLSTCLLSPTTKFIAPSKYASILSASSKHVQEDASWKVACDFLHFSYLSCHRLPEFDLPAHNHHRQDVERKLSQLYRKAIEMISSTDLVTKNAAFLETFYRQYVPFKCFHVMFKM